MPTLAPALEDDFPALALLERTVAVEAGRGAVRKRLRRLDPRIDGAGAPFLRTQAVPSAYRAFARQIGLDPEADGDPLGTLLVRRIVRGTLPSFGPVADACTIALIETGVPVWGLDGSAVAEPLDIGVAADLSLVVRAGERVVAPLLGDPDPQLRGTKETRVARLYALVVDGVPVATVEEALWVAGETLGP